MITMDAPRLLGSKTRTEALMLLALLDESYPSELARLLGARLFSIQKIVDDLDRQGVIASRHSGNLRRVSLSPTFLAGRELRALLLRLVEGYPEIEKLAAARRSRPRRMTGAL